MDDPDTRRALLEQITEQTTDTIIRVDREGRFDYINRPAPGLTQEDVIGSLIFDHITEDQQAEVRGCLERVAASREGDRYFVTYQLPSGKTSRWESRVGPLIEGDEVVGFVIIASDVTERQEAAAERDRLFELSLDLLCVANKNGYLTRVNPAFLDLLGYTHDEITSKPFLEFVLEDDRERTEAAFRELLTEKTSITGFVNRYRSKSGEPRTLEWAARMDPVTEQLIGVARDVTEARALQDQLRQAQKLDAVGQLAGGIAHDFNNLLQAILGNVHFARAEQPNTQVLSYLDQVEAAAERATELTRKLLSFSRNQPTAFLPVDLNALARELLGLLRRVIPENITIDLVAGHRLDRVAGDRTQLEQVLMNLCLNARDAMPNGGKISIETENILINGSYREHHPWAKPGRYVLVSISDTGTGIAEEIRERVFEPFFTTKPTGKGSGLGLSTVYGIVQQHEGMINLYSEVEQGTTFKVYLPVQLRLASKVGSKIDGTGKGDSEIVLIAEDEPLVREIVVRTLESAGYQVLVAANGREAIKLCQAYDDIDLALFDVVMPELSGPDAAAKLREIRPDLPVLFSSGYSDTSRFAADLPEGTDVLKKPYRINTLLSRVRQAIAEGRH